MAQYDINLREYWRILKKRKFIVIITALILLIFSPLIAKWRAPAELYASTCSIKFERETTLEGLYATALSWSGGDDIETQISIIKSYAILVEVAKNMGLLPKKDTTDALNLTPDQSIIIEGLQAKVEVERREYTNIIDIRITDRNRNFAQELAKTIALTYKKIHADEQGNRTKEAKRYIEKIEEFIDCKVGYVSVGERREAIIKK